MNSFINITARSSEGAQLLFRSFNKNTMRSYNYKWHRYEELILDDKMIDYSNRNYIVNEIDEIIKQNYQK